MIRHSRANSNVRFYALIPVLCLSNFSVCSHAMLVIHSEVMHKSKSIKAIGSQNNTACRLRQSTLIENEADINYRMQIKMTECKKARSQSNRK